MDTGQIEHIAYLGRGATVVHQNELAGGFEVSDQSKLRIDLNNGEEIRISGKQAEDAWLAFQSAKSVDRPLSNHGLEEH